MLAHLKIRVLIALSAAGLGLLGTGCLKDDVGTCCQVFDESKMDLIPVPPEVDPADPTAKPASVIRQDPAFDCSGLTCTAYQGSKAFCTRQCEDEADCPEGFSCAPVLDSDPGPGAMIGPNDKFCVRTAHSCDSWEP